MRAHRRSIAQEPRTAELAVARASERAAAFAGEPAGGAEVERTGEHAPVAMLRAPRALALAAEMPLRAGRRAPRRASLDAWRAPDPMTKR